MKWYCESLSEFYLNFHRERDNIFAALRQSLEKFLRPDETPAEQLRRTMGSPWED